MRTLKKNYAALGSYLHASTLKQLASAGQDFEKLRKRLEGIIDYVDEVLASPIFTINFGGFATANCMRCEKELRRRIPRGAETLESECYDCGALYDVELLDGDRVHWHPRRVEAPCMNPECNEKGYLWADEVKVGTVWVCDACESKHELILSQRPYRDPADDTLAGQKEGVS